MISRVVSVQYHRNGVAGNGFHVVEFTFRANPRGVSSMIGIVFDGRGDVAVVQPDAPMERWRGDDFEPELRQAVAEYEQRRSAEVQTI